MADSNSITAAPEATARKSESIVVGDPETETPRIAPTDEALSRTSEPDTVEGAESESTPIAPAPELPSRHPATVVAGDHDADSPTASAPEAPTRSSETSTSGEPRTNTPSVAPAPEAHLRSFDPRIAEDPEKQQIEEVIEDEQDWIFSPSAISASTLTPGYAELAGLMGINPGLTIFRRFNALNAQNLLYMQAELIELEGGLRNWEKRNLLSSEPEVRNRLRHWPTLSEAPEYKTYILRIRKLLKEYDEALLTFNKVLSISVPQLHEVKEMEYFANSDPVAIHALPGWDSSVWGCKKKKHRMAPDLGILAPLQYDDSVSDWMSKLVIKHGARFGLHRLLGPPSTLGGLVAFETRNVVQVTSFMTNAIASLLPVASIVILYIVESVPAKFGLIAGFNVLVTLCLTVFTNAKRTDIFAVTAAFVAVQVVFIGVNER